MDHRQMNRRSWGLVALLALILLFMSSVLYDTQVINGKYWASRSTNKITEIEQVTSARGQLLDRYGRVLASNETTYEVTLNTSAMGKKRSEILMELIEIARKSGVTWADNLSITPEAPFRYTRDDPFFAVSTGEDGKEKKTLTRLGRLSIKMKWIEGDPTTPGAKVELPSAQELLERMAKTFDIPEGTSQADTRALVGVMYELYLRSKDIYWTPYVFAKDVDIDFISRVKERGLAGVNIDAVSARSYNTNYAAHLLGPVGLMSEKEWEYYQTVDENEDGKSDYQINDMVGKDGAELAFESYLRGAPGKRQVDRDVNGKVMGETWIIPPEPGDNVMLTVDIDLQKAVEDIMADAIPRLKSKDVEGAACVVLDVKNAEVLAAASYPAFSLDTYYENYNEYAANPLHPFINRATMGLYPPGSTFKMVTAIAGLEEKEVTPQTKILGNGVYDYYGPDGPQCWIYRQYRRTHGPQNVTEALKNSCNIYFFDVGRRVGIEKLQEYAAKFGLGEPTGIELPEKKGVMAGPEYTEKMGGKWYDGNTLSVAIGQESSQFTPMQLANFIATLVNGGTRNAVHILKEVKSHDFSEVVYTYEPEVLSEINIKPENLEAVKAGMLKLTTEGSVAQYFKDLPVQVGAKTGSAQVNAQTESNAVFVCFAPYDKPQIAIALVVEKGGSGSELGRIAADILKYYFSAEETREDILTENTMVR